MSLTVDNPAIQEVLNLETGEHLPVAKVIGDEHDKVSQLRLALMTNIQRACPTYECSLCGAPVYLVCRSNGGDSSKGRAYFFRHTLEDGRCEAKTRGKLSQEEISAIKYNGAKESKRHLQMKEWVFQSLSADPHFSDVDIEKRITQELTGAWRRPDIRAKFRGVQLVFEIQLSTTYLDVIAARRQFYLKDGALLIWIFATFSNEDRRLTQDDVFYNNNQNAFLVNQESLQASLAKDAFHIECLWSEPTSATGVLPLQRRLISFHDLKLDQEKQQAYFFDFYGQREAFILAEDLQNKKLRDEFEAYFLPLMALEKVDSSKWWGIRKNFHAAGIKLPTFEKELPRQLLVGLYSARYGRPVGCRLKAFIEVVHHATSPANLKYLRLFRLGLAAFDRGAQIQIEDKTEKWRRKVNIYKAGIRRGDPEYIQDTSHDALIEFLFPELGIYQSARRGH